MAFRGDWFDATVPCGNSNPVALQVDDNMLSFDEFSGKVEKVTASKDDTITLEITYSAEGHVWKSIDRFTLRPNGELTIQPARTVARYRRCSPTTN